MNRNREQLLFLFPAVWCFYLCHLNSDVTAHSVTSLERPGDKENTTWDKTCDPESNPWPCLCRRLLIQAASRVIQDVHVPWNGILFYWARSKQTNKQTKSQKPRIWGPAFALWRRPVTQPAVDQNHQQVSCLPKYTGRVCAGLRAPVTMRPLCSSGCQPVCPRVLFPSNLHLTFRLTAFLSPFFPTNFLWGDYLWAASDTHRFRWHDTHTHTKRVGARFDGTCHSLPRTLQCAGNNVSRTGFNKLTTNCVNCVVCLRAADRANLMMHSPC